MTGVSITQAPVADEPEVPVAGTARLPSWFADYHGWIAMAIYLLAILWYEHQVVGHLGSMCSCQNTDPTQWMWIWRWIPYAIGHGMNPLVTHEIWNPVGYDLAATTPAPFTAILGVPLEALFGPLVAYNVVMFTAPVLSGWAAYRLCRYLSGAPWASVLAGYTYGFSAYEIGHLLGHLDLIFVFVPPLMVLVVLRFLDGEISRLKATVFATLLLLIQFALNSEVLLDMSYLGAIALVIAFVAAPNYRRRLLGSAVMLIVAYVALGVICSYYLYTEFRGPSESAATAQLYPADLISYAIPTGAFGIGGHELAGISGKFYTPSSFEQNNYLGLPLCGIVLAFLFAHWRRRATKIIGLSTIVAFVLTLGFNLTVAGQMTLRMPFYWLYKLPLIDLSIPSRIGLFVSLGAALAAALWISWATTRASRIWRWLVGLAAVAFLLPSLSWPDRINTPAQPTFFTTATYKHYLTRNEEVLTFPFSQAGPAMIWQADTHMYFKLFDGYLGYTPKRYLDSPIFPQLFYNLPPTESVARQKADFHQILTEGQIGAVVIQDGQGGYWPSYLLKLHWHLQADVGGVQVYKPAAGTS